MSPLAGGASHVQPHSLEGVGVRGKVGTAVHGQNAALGELDIDGLARWAKPDMVRQTLRPAERVDPG
jgi:hypothetical protein